MSNDLPAPADAVTVRLIRMVLEMSEEQRRSLLRRLETTIHSPPGLGEREDVRFEYAKPVDVTNGSESFAGLSRDISGNGMFIKSGKTVSTGENVVLRVPYSDDQKRVKIPATVVRVTADGFGVRFIREQP